MSNINIDESFSDSVIVHSDIKQDIIMISKDKLTLKISNYKKIVEKRFLLFTPISLFFSLLLTLLTSDFKNRFGITADQWFIIFCILCILSIIYFLYLLYIIITNSNSSNEVKFIEDIIQSCGRDDLDIIEATYGANGTRINITKEIKNKIINNQLKIKVSNTIAGDPIPGVKKDLKIKYKYRGHTFNKTFDESTSICVP